MAFEYLDEETTTAAPTGFKYMDAEPQAPVEAPVAPVKPPSMVESMFGLGSPIARVIKGGVVDPLLGVNQLLANALPFGNAIQQGANNNVRAYDQATDQARAELGSTGFDFYQLGGAVVSPYNKITGALQTATKGALNAVGRSASTGAVLAAAEPVRGEDKDFVEAKLNQMAIGAVLGPVVEGGIKTLGAVYKIGKGLTVNGRKQAMIDHIDTLIGPEKTEALELMRDARQLVTGSRPTVADVLADLPSAVDLIAAQNKLSSKQGLAGFFAVRTADNQAARLRAIETVSGTPEARLALAAERNATTGVMRETALDQSDTAGPVFTRLEKEISDKFNSVAAAEMTAGMQGLAGTNQAAISRAGRPGWLTAGDIGVDAATSSGVYKGRAGDIRQEAKLKQFQLKSLEQNGFFPLKASEIVDQLDVAIRGATKDEVKAILRDSRDKILSKADENGLLSSRDLYDNVRQVLNRDIVKATTKQGQPFTGGLNAVEAKTSTNVKKFIDVALNKSSDGLWSQYIDSYVKYSTKLNRMEVGSFLAAKLSTPLNKESAGAFAAAVENAAATIKRSTGIPRFTKLNQILTEGEEQIVNNIRKDLERSSKAEELSKLVGNVDDGLGPPVGEGIDVLNRAVSVMKSALRYLQQGNQKEFDKSLAQFMLDPASAAQFMTIGVKQGQIAEFTSALMKGMDPRTRSAFQQAFVIPTAAEEAAQ